MFYRQRHKKVSESIKELQTEPKIDTESTSVWVDFSRLNQLSDRVENHYYDNEETKEKDDSVSQQALMYLKSSMDKDERIFKLENAIHNNKVSTVQEASHLLEVGKSTIIKYLREIDETLLDESKNKQVGSTKEYKLSESKQLGHHGKKNKYKPIFKYYDGDPTLGANEITYEEHVKRIKQFKERKLNLLEQIQ